MIGSIANHEPWSHGVPTAIYWPLLGIPIMSSFPSSSSACARKNGATAASAASDTAAADATDITTPTLSAVMDKAGPHVLSYLPLGSLLNGYRSPMLTSSTFHKSTYLHLGNVEILSLSRCAHHYRKLDDDALIRLIGVTIQICSADHPNRDDCTFQQHQIASTMETKTYGGVRPTHVCSSSRRLCPCGPLLKLQYLDLSRCRMLRGRGVQFALKHMPNLRRVSLASCTRFDAKECFNVNDPNVDSNVDGVQERGDLEFSKLQLVDVSGCPRIDSVGCKVFLTRINTGHIRYLDLSACSTLTNDDIAAPICYGCNNLEHLGLAGLKKITNPTVGLILYTFRKTLRSLNLRGCEGVFLPYLLNHHIPTIRQFLSRSREGEGSQIPAHFREGVQPTRSWDLFLGRAISHMLELLPHVATESDLRFALAIQEAAEQFEQRFITPDQSSETHETHPFGNLETLDIGLIGSSYDQLQGCVAIIAWLAGGRLKDVNICGLQSVSNHDLAALAAISGDNLRSLSVSCAAGSRSSLLSTDLPLLELKDLNLSRCGGLFCSNNFNMSWILVNTVVTLNLDSSFVKEDLLKNIAKMNRLLKLSLYNCIGFKISGFAAYRSRFANSNLLELDVRETKRDCPLSELCNIFPTLLKLNNRVTELGKSMLEEHTRIERWRCGAQETATNKSGKRKRGARSCKSSNNSNDVYNEDCYETLSRCSLTRTGFSQSKHTEQEMFACLTCRIHSGRFVCYICAKECHVGHNLVPSGYGAGYCDCVILSTCSCLPGADTEYCSDDNISDGEDT